MSEDLTHPLISEVVQQAHNLANTDLISEVELLDALHAPFYAC